MSKFEKSLDELREMFASAVSLREGAQALLSFGDRHADSTAALCHASAVRMMSAYIELNGIELAPDEDMAADLWSACLSDCDELDAVDDEAQVLLDCGSSEFPKSLEKAQIGVDCAIRLEQAMLEAEPELAPNQSQSMGMGM